MWEKYRDAIHAFIIKTTMVEFAPLNTPLERRLQTLAATAWIVTFVCGGFFFSLLLLYFILYTSFWWAALLYVLWIYIDREAPIKGGKRVEWVRRWAWWRFYRDFFPIRLERTCELSPDRNYLFACYPHGVLCSGVFGHFAVQSPECDRLFPGFQITAHTLDQNFSQPVIRDLITSLGMRGASYEAFLGNLSEGQGRISVLVVGGAAEALKSKPGHYNIILKRRRGFIKVAFKSGASLVPVFSFGETELYDQLDNPDGSWLRFFQENFRKIIGIAPVIFLGRGIFQYTFGMVPQRRTVTVVVGEPIPVTRNPEPTPQQVEELHTIYTTALQKLFDSHKDRLLKDSKIFLNIE